MYLSILRMIIFLEITTLPIEFIFDWNKSIQNNFLYKFDYSPNNVESSMIYLQLIFET